eukprot:12926200-Prorocentrum_lima.AAC.1
MSWGSLTSNALAPAAILAQLSTQLAPPAFLASQLGLWSLPFEEGLVWDSPRPTLWTLRHHGWRGAAH